MEGLTQMMDHSGDFVAFRNDFDDDDGFDNLIDHYIFYSNCLETARDDNQLDHHLFHTLADYDSHGPGFCLFDIFGCFSP